MPINVVAYDPRWPQRFAEERARLEQVLAPWLTAGVHHIGSTAVPGLSAKPIIDMVAGVADLAEARSAADVLADLDYAYAPHRPEAHWFHKPAATAGFAATHGLHLTEPGSDLWRERFAFRDALRADAALREEYQALKLELAGLHGEPAAYTAGKRGFVARVLAGAGIALGAPRALPAGREVTVVLDKQPRPDVRYPATVQSDDGNHLVVRAPWAGPPVHDMGFARFERGDLFTEHFWRDRWYSIKEVRDADGRLKGWYCDVTRPAIVDTDTVTVHDLDLDLWLSPSGEILHLDEDEFLASGLTDADPGAAAQARTALADLDALARTGFAALAAPPPER